MYKNKLCCYKVFDKAVKAYGQMMLVTKTGICYLAQFILCFYQMMQLSIA